MLALAAWRLELDRREHTQTIQTPMTLTSHVQSHRLSVKSVLVCYSIFAAGHEGRGSHKTKYRHQHTRARKEKYTPR